MYILMNFLAFCMRKELIGHKLFLLALKRPSVYANIKNNDNLITGLNLHTKVKMTQHAHRLQTRFSKENVFYFSN